MLTLILTCDLLLIVYLNTSMVAMTVSVQGKGIKIIRKIFVISSVLFNHFE